MERLKVLVADDEAGMRMAIRRVLESYQVQPPDEAAPIGFTVDEASDGAEALRQTDALRPDILLLDYKLPDITGMEILARLAENHADVMPIMITAYASIETAVSATKRGAHDFLSKPFTPDELKTAVYRAAKVRLLHRRARALAQEKRQVRFELLSVVSHELKAPLAAIESHLNIIKNRSAGNSPEVYDTLVERCLVRARGMRKLILDLLDSARIESGRKPRVLENLDLGALLGQAVETVRPDAQQRSITIELVLPQEIRMTADRDELDMVFNNLISNAVKYNRAGGRIRVELTRAGAGIVLKVADTGFGMSRSDCNRIFTEFTRIRNRQTQDIPGSGLGLSIVKKIVALYGGYITVDSETDVGSTFTVTLGDAAMPAAAEKATL